MSIERATVSMEIPPRNAVHQEHDRRICPQQRGNLSSHRRQSRRLHRDDDRVLFPELSRIIAGPELHVDGRVGRFDSQTARADRRQMLAACDHGNVGPTPGEITSEITADGAGAENANAHAYASSSSAARDSA